MTANQYLLLKSLHIFGVILFLGNIIVTGFWKGCADLTRNWRVIVFSQRLVTYTDFVFTGVGVILILITGLSLAHNYGNFWQIKWIAWGLSLFIASGVIWIAILIPLQVYLHRLANACAKQENIPARYWLYEWLWLIFGIIATLLPLANLYLMVFKP